MRGFVTAFLNIGGEKVKVEVNFKLIVQALIEAGNLKKAAEHCLELVCHGVGFSPEARQALFEQGKELSVRVGDLEPLLPVIDHLAGKLEGPEAKATFLQNEGDHFAAHEAYLGAAELYEKAAELISPEKAGALTLKLAPVYEKLGDQLVQLSDGNAAAKKAYETALELWRKIGDKRQVLDCQLKLVAVVTVEEAIKLYSAAARLSLECGSGRAEGDKIILRAIFLVSAERQLVLWQEYDQLATKLAPTEIPTGLPPVIEAARQKAAISVGLRKTIGVARSIVGNREHHQAFNMLVKAGQAADEKRGLIGSDRTATALLAEMWLLCAEQGRITLEKNNSIKAETVIAAYLRAQELMRSSGQEAEARGLDVTIGYIRQRERTRRGDI